MIKQERLYYQIPYIKTFQTEVVSCEPRGDGCFLVCLEQTGFYPEGGGQPSDTGTLGGVKVLDVHEQDGKILHKTDGELKAGSYVTGDVEWERRFCHMQQHTGEHLVSGLVYKYFGYDNVGFHMGSQEVTVDFNGVLTETQLKHLEDKANQLIYENLPVYQRFPTEEELHKLDYRSKKELIGQVRIIEIPGGDICACCGTHVASTGEVGIIKFVHSMHYKGGTRVSMLCGKRALLDYRQKHGQITGISNLLSAKPNLVKEAVQNLKKESQEKDQAIAKLYQSLFEIKTSQFPKSSQLLTVFEEGLAPQQLRQFCTLLYEQEKGAAVLLCSKKGPVFSYVLGSRDYDMKQLAAQLNKRLDGKGGGSRKMVQGTFSASREEIESAAGEAFSAAEEQKE